MWIWGVLLAVWLAAVVGALLWGAFAAAGAGRCAEPSLYCVVERNGSPVSAITAVLGVIWGWFVKMNQDLKATPGGGK